MLPLSFSPYARYSRHEEAAKNLAAARSEAKELAEIRRLARINKKEAAEGTTRSTIGDE